MENKYMELKRVIYVDPPASKEFWELIDSLHALLAENERLTAQNKKMREMVKLCHAAMLHEWMACPFCTGYIASMGEEKHAPDCELAAILKEEQ